MGSVLRHNHEQRQQLRYGGELSHLSQCGDRGLGLGLLPGRGVAVVGGYCPLGSEISPLPATEEARSVGAIVAYPCFANPAKPFRFLAGDPLEPGPFGMMQPAKRHPVVQPDLVLVPLIAIDSAGTRLGRGKGHYDRALIGLKKTGARLVGVGWQIQRLTEAIPADEWDVPLHAFASPDGIEWFK